MPCINEPKADFVPELYWVYFNTTRLSFGRYGVVLKKLELLREAVEMFVAAVNQAPLFWGAWLELTLLVTDKEMVVFLHWEGSMDKFWILCLNILLWKDSLSEREFLKLASILYKEFGGGGI